MCGIQALLCLTSTNISSFLFSEWSQKWCPATFGHLGFSGILPFASLWRSALLAIAQLLHNFHNFALPFLFLFLCHEYLPLSGQMPPPLWSCSHSPLPTCHLHPLQSNCLWTPRNINIKADFLPQWQPSINCKFLQGPNQKILLYLLDH